MIINWEAVEENRKKDAKAQEEASHPIICKTIEEKERVIREWSEKEENWKKEHPVHCFPNPYLSSHFYRPDIFTETEHLERNKSDDFYPELLPRYFVCSEGNDHNDGLSRQKPFKTLEKALMTAKKGTIKRIEVVGTLSDKSEQNTSKPIAFTIDDTGNDEITICGQIVEKSYNDLIYPSRLEAVHSRQVIAIGSKNHIVRIRFRNIAIFGGKEGGVTIKDANAIIGKGVSITGNGWYGICIDSGGSLVMEEGSTVSNNEGGGVCMKSNASFDLKGGVISNNRPQIFHRYIGGVSIHGRKSIFRMSGGIISHNQSPPGYSSGGGVSITDQEDDFGPYDEATFDKFLKRERKNAGIDNGSIFEMTGGSIIGNKAYQGGGVSIKSPCTFKLHDGVIMGNIAKIGGGVCVSELAQLKNCGKPEEDYPIVFEMIGGYIMGNLAQKNGGGISAIVGSVGPYESIRILCTNGRITGNKAIRGGGIYLPDGCFHLSGNVIVNDNIAKYGGGVYIGHGFNIMRRTRFDIEGNTKISGNIAEFWGGGICIADGICIMNKGVIKENIAKEGGGVFPGTSEEISQMEHDKVFDPDPLTHNPLLRLISGKQSSTTGIFQKIAGDIKNNLPNNIHHDR